MASRKFFTFKNKRHLPKPLAFLLACLLKLYAWTLRVHFIDHAGVLANGYEKIPHPLVIALWHNRILFAPPLIPREILERCVVMVSASRDGEYISTLVKRFGLESVRGSSSRHGAGALLALERAVCAGKSPILTVDGPRGPKYTVHPGAIALARSRQVPLLPFVINARHFWQLKSWDRMQIPCPFSRVDIEIGRPVAVAPDEELADATERLRNALLEITRDS